MIANSDKPVFPTPWGTSEWGLTKREYFAGLAMQGLIASCAHPDSIGSELKTFSTLPQEAVKYADALLAELEK